MKKTNSVVAYYMFLVEGKNQNRLFLGSEQQRNPKNFMNVHY